MFPAPTARGATRFAVALVGITVRSTRPAEHGPESPHGGFGQSWPSVCSVISSAHGIAAAAALRSTVRCGLVIAGSSTTAPRDNPLHRPTSVTGYYGVNIPYPGSGTTIGVVVSAVLAFGVPVGFLAYFRQ